ncbi:MAG: zinc ABC transporter substrate-binding protein, partial [Candidatus Thioglobus sp.]
MSRLLLTLLALLSANVYSAPNIVVSIAPIHSIVSNITQGVTEPKLLLKGNQSAHHAHLVPSQLSMIEQANLIVIMHPNFEVGLSKSLSQLNTKTVLLVNDDINNHHSWVDIQKMEDFS